MEKRGEGLLTRLSSREGSSFMMTTGAKLKMGEGNADPGSVIATGIPFSSIIMNPRTSSPVLEQALDIRTSRDSIANRSRTERWEKNWFAEKQADRVISDYRDA